MLMRQKCLLSYISCRLGFAFQIIFILNRWSLILIWTCLLFSENCLSQPSNTASLMFFAIFKVFSNLKTWGRTWQCVPMTDFYRKVNKFFQKFAKCDPCLSEKHWITVSACKMIWGFLFLPQGQEGTRKSTCKSIQQKYKANLCGATYYFFCMAWKCRCKFFFSWNDTILRPRSNPETYGCRSWIWGVCMKQMLYAKFRSDRLKRDLPFSANGNDWIRLNFLQNNRLFVCLYIFSLLFSKALESPYGDCL